MAAKKANQDKTQGKETRWHSTEADDVLKEFNTSADEGLSAAEAKKRLKKHGPNKLPGKKKKGWLLRFLEKFHNVLIYLLLAAAVITALMDEWVETFVILAVVIINVLISFIQEGRAEKALEGIKQMLSLEAQVIRDGERSTIEAEDLVPGDIVVLHSGDKVPADLRLLESVDLRVEESPLTGESEDVDKGTDPVAENAVLGDRSCLAFSGTTVTYGEATGVVVATAEKTEIGNISEMMSEVEDSQTPLMKKIDSFGKILAVVIVLMASGFFAVAYFLRDFELQDAFMAAISIVVASIPEGLPAIMTITLALGVERMAKRHAIIRKLPSVETLGAVSVICSDKTGTLTRNEMTARDAITATSSYKVEGTGYKPEGKIFTEDGDEVEPSDDSTFEKMLWAMRLCNESEIREEDGKWKLEGTPTEGALLTLAYKAGLEDIEAERIDLIPFDSEKKYMATLHELEGKRYVFVNGAPEKLLELCEKQQENEDTGKLDKDAWQEKMDNLAGKGRRVLASAYNEVSDSESDLNQDDLEKGLVFLGITGIIDPPRDEAIDSVKACKEAGMRVVMITGDHSKTATSIAEELGIDHEEGAITGEELEEMGDDEIREAVMKYNVFARTNPEHKLRLVEALQANNRLCGMTGDGVNDAPALKKADIGIAMGIKGTEVAKEASEMVLADDNFASIVNAVEEGRTIYDNLKKTILFLLPANGAEALVIIAAIVLGMTLPISPVQVLWINMVSAVTLALALSVEPMEQQVMKRPPRDPDKPILGGHFIWRVVFVSLLSGSLTFTVFNLNYQNGLSLEEARTLAINMLVGGHVYYLLTCRKLHESSFSRKFFDNRFVFLAIGLLILLQLLLTYVPFMNELFSTAPIAASLWLYPLLGGSIVFFLVELEKLITKRLFK
jgi:P-type Ca2+ transporter type 2C